MALIEINTDGLAKLGATISYALGFTAFGRKEMANAESYAAIKQAKTNTQIELLKLKGDDEVANYFLAREKHKMNNAKSIVEKAKSHFTEREPVSNDPVNIDWTNRFFSIAEDISDETLQDMWGRILAGEVKKPKSYSLRTLEILRNITKEEAELFVKAARFCIEDYICTEKRFALSLDETLLLGEIGLLNGEDLVKTWKVEPKNALQILINQDIIMTLYNHKERQIDCSTSIKKLSKAGIEILSLIEKMNRDNFYYDLARFFKSRGIDRVIKHDIVKRDGTHYKYNMLGEELAI